MAEETFLLPLAVCLPLLGAIFIAGTRDNPNQRETVTLLTAASLAVVVLLAILPLHLAGLPLHYTALEPIPGLAIAFSVEPLGMTFAAVASSLWILNSLYSIGYMRGNREPHQTRFYICFAIALSSTMGVALADNLFTLFIFYEVLSLSTYPLVAHHEDEKSLKAGRTYIGLLMGTSIGLWMLAIIWIWVEVGTLNFEPGGILSERVGLDFASLLLLLFMFGIGKAALMPIHRWLPAAMVAPTPVSALLHAVAVVKTGVFCVVKVSAYTFGTDFLAQLWSTDLILYLAAFVILASSLVAIRQDNLKRRLAYSTVSQLSYVTLGAMLANGIGIVGAAMHIPMHAFGKITLFFCAGAIYTALHKTEISDMNGIGRLMPFTLTAFLIGALCVIGLPPMGGSWSKFFLALGAAESGHLLLIAVLMLSSLLNVVYLIGPVIRAFFYPLPDTPAGPVALQEAPAFSVVPLCLTAAGCVVLFFIADDLYALLKPLGGLP